MPKIGIIGSGIGGLAAAVRLAVKGYEVKVFEKEGIPGGKLSQIKRDGFRFDTGPSLFTLPSLLEEILALDTSDDKKFEYVPLDNVCRYFYPDGLFIDAFRDVDRFASEIEEKTTVSAKKVKTYLRQSEEIYHLTKDVFIFNDLRNLKNFLNFGTLKSILMAWKLHPFRSLHEENRRSFNDEKVIQLFDRFATYNGSDPYRAPATLKVIPHLEHNIGAFFPKKGMYSIAEVLVRMAQDAGVSFHFSEEIKSITNYQGRVTGIQSDKGSYDFDFVISDADVNSIPMLLGKPSEKGPEHDTQLSSSALIFYWGMKIDTNSLKLHNILFSKDYKHEFNCLFDQHTLTDDPTVYIFISSKEVPDDAPPGHENWFVMINAPRNKGQDWDELTTVARKNIINKIQEMLGIDVEKHLLFEHHATPETIEMTTGSYQGALYGLNSNSVDSAFRRHPNYLRSMKGLYFVGGSVHPGGGIPLCLASAKIVSDQFSDLNE